MELVILSAAKDLLFRSKRRRLSASVALASLALAVALPAPASTQTLARPHWAGSGVTSEPWWLRGVFYRIDPARFQDSDGDGRGDFLGVAQRLSYIQSLGVDAIILDPRMDDPGMDGDDTASVPTDDFGTLAREAANFRLRLMVSLPLADRSHHLLPDQVILAAARRWLAQGAAGLFLDSVAIRALATDPARAVGLLHQLRVLINSVPGDRVLIATTGPVADPDLDHAIDAAVQLRAGAPIGEQPTSAGVIRIQLQGLLHEDRPASPRSKPSTSAPLLHAARPVAGKQSEAPERGLERTLATAMLGSRAAVLIDFGQEVGEQSSASGSSLMQWTPTNVTLPPLPQAAPEPPKKPAEEFGAYHPYVPPPPKSLVPTPTAPEVVLTDAPPPVPPERMPGFTPVARKADVESLMAANGGTANVLVQDSDPASLLNLYRRLIQLHHGDPTLHNGVTEFLQYDTLNALVWVRRAPASVRTSYDIIVICSLSAQPSVLFLEDDLAALHVRPGALRNLLSSGPSPTAVGTTSFVKVPAYSVFLGELYR
jgi:alpha-glucosidase